ncbi:MAG: phenylacetic acid degradation operon negative regulatory protein PaaX [Steroidobacter sp.]
MAKKAANQFIAKTNALLARFRKQRPLRGGSLLVTILGDAIAPRGGMIALGSLIQLAEPFGLTERLVRTSIGRLANEQWVSSQRSGRSSYYSLTSHGKARFAEATQRIYGVAPDAWDGQWTLVIMPPSLKGSRDSLRDELNWLGFGQLTPSVFAHPTHKEHMIRSRLAELESTGELIVIQGAIVTHTSDANLVAMGWDFGDLARRYRRFIQMFGPLEEGLSAQRALTAPDTAFVLRTLLLHEYRKIHLRDPLLPASLLPANWVGADAQTLCRSLYAKVFSASERYLSASVQTVSGNLPSPAEEIFHRFGGLPRI